MPRTTNMITVCLFFGMLALPGLGFVLSHSRQVAPVVRDGGAGSAKWIAENRELASQPAGDIAEFPKEFEAYFRDRVAFRQPMLQAHQSVMYRWFDVPVMASVWIGRDDWLFLNVSDPWLGRANGPTIEARLDAWCDEFQTRQTWLKERNIDYIVVIVPEKSSVYPEYLRGFPKRHPPPEPSDYIEKRLVNGGVKVVNPLPAMREAKPDHLLYSKFDTHWTAEGAWLAYQQTATQLQWNVQPRSAYTPMSMQRVGDLCKLAGRTVEAGTETVEVWQPPTTPAKMQPETLLLYDSFGESWLNLLASDCMSMKFEKTTSLPRDTIDQSRPKVVIQLLAARHLYMENP